MPRGTTLLVAALAAAALVAWSLATGSGDAMVRAPDTTPRVPRAPHPTPPPVEVVPPRSSGLVVRVRSRSTKAPIADARIDATFPSAGDSSTTATTDALGRATIAPPAGASNCEVVVHAVGFVRGWFPSVDLGPARPETLDVLLATGRDVEGRVVDAATGKPVVGATASTRTDAFFAARFGRSGPDFGSAVSDADGVIRLGRVPYNEPVSVEIRAPGHAPLVRDARTWPNDRTEIALPPARIVRGTVRTTQGVAAGGAALTVTIGDSEDSLTTASAAADGTFDIDGVPGDGEFRIRAELHPEGGGRLVSARAAIPASAADMRIEVGKPPSFRVRALRPDGAPLDGIPVKIWPLRGEADDSGTDAELRETADRGDVFWPAPPCGRYRLLVDAPEFAPYETTVVLGVDEAKALEARVPAGKSVSGIVVDASGAPARGADVSTVIGRAEPRHATTDADGRFRLVGLTAGAHELLVRGADPGSHVRVAATAPSTDVRAALPPRVRLTTKAALPAGLRYPVDVTISFPGDPDGVEVTRRAESADDAREATAPSARGDVRVRTTGCVEESISYQAGPDGACDLGVVQCRRALRLGVAVVDEDGEPVLGASVTVTPAAGGPARSVAVLHTDGSLEVADLAAGAYDVHVEAPGFAATTSRCEVAFPTKPVVAVVARAK
jgi:hypothetical protein